MNQKGYTHIAAIVTIGLIAIAMTTVMFWFSMEVDQRNSVTIASINSFEECIAAGFPAMESHPRQCNDGTKTHVEVLTNINTSLNINESSLFITDEWPTYVNTPYGYSFQYPDSFTAEPTDDATGVTFIDAAQGIITVSVVRETYNVDSLITDTSEYSNIAPVKVGNLNGYAYSYADAGCGFNNNKVPHSEATVYVSFTSCQGATDPITLDEALQKQILETFNFDPTTIITQ